MLFHSLQSFFPPISLKLFAPRTLKGTIGEGLHPHRGSEDFTRTGFIRHSITVRLREIADRTAEGLVAFAQKQATAGKKKGGKGEEEEEYGAIVGVYDLHAAARDITEISTELAIDAPIDISAVRFDQRWEAELKRVAAKMKIERPTWLNMPWFAVETWFYARVRQACGARADAEPFAPQKAGLLREAMAALPRLSRTTDIAALLRVGLHGNTAELSMHPGGTTVTSDVSILIDDADKVRGHLESRRRGTVALIVDNAGFELCADLALADRLIREGLAEKVAIHIKDFSAFVSDVTSRDLLMTPKEIKEHFSKGDDDEDTKSVQQMAERWTENEGAGRFAVHRNDFWNSPLPLWKMPGDLRDHFETCSLAIFKGDANYRRAHGDLRWPLETPTSEVMCYFPCPSRLHFSHTPPPPFLRSSNHLSLSPERSLHQDTEVACSDGRIHI